MADEKKPLVLTPWEDNLCAVIRSRNPGIVIQTTEEQRALASLEQVLLYMALGNLGKRTILVWSPVSLIEIDPVEKAACDPKKGEVYKPKEMNPVDFVPLLKKFKTEAGTPQNPVMSVLVLADSMDEINKAKGTRMLREALWEIRGTFRTIVLIGHGYDLPPQVAADFSLQKFELPTQKDLIATLTPQINLFKTSPTYKDRVQIDDTASVRFARACAGLTENEARSLLGLAISRFRALDDRAVTMALNEKAHIADRSNGVLEYKTISGGLDRIGGLEFAKAWIRELDDCIKNEEETRAYGQKMPSGCIALGIPGCGKSLLAEMLAAHWQLPLLIFNVARAFGGIVGQTEGNIEMVKALAKACAPCVLMLDEIEKALGGDGELDGGTSTRVKGQLLSWLQNKPEGVFVIATANDITKFERSPEMIRAGRFDKVFFVDLPDLRARIEILSIHYRLAVERAKSFGVCKLAESIPSDILVEAAKAQKGFSGAEIEVIMQAALRKARAKRATHPTVEMLLASTKETKPLSITMGESIKVLRAWAADGRAVAAGATLEDESKDEKAFKDYGLPQLLAGSGE